MITLTETARDKIAEVLAEAGVPLGGVRIAAILGGCAGIRYALSLERTAAPGDTVVHDGGASLYIDAESGANLDGTVIDFVETVGQGGFTFANPNAPGRCSCGDPNAACGR